VTVLQYLTEEYSIHRFSFFTLVEILNNCGVTEGRKELNELLQAGTIAKRKGANGVIIEFLKPEK